MFSANAAASVVVRVLDGNGNQLNSGTAVANNYVANTWFSGPGFAIASNVNEVTLQAVMDGNIDIYLDNFRVTC